MTKEQKHNPQIPPGYRRLALGETIWDGDLFWCGNESWTSSAYDGEKRVGDPGTLSFFTKKPFNYIRSVELEPSRCLWKYDHREDGFFTECGTGYHLADPEEIGMHYKFCPGCGREIRVQQKEVVPVG